MHLGADYCADLVEHAPSFSITTTDGCLDASQQVFLTDVRTSCGLDLEGPLRAMRINLADESHRRRWNEFLAALHHGIEHSYQFIADTQVQHQNTNNKHNYNYNQTDEDDTYDIEPSDSDVSDQVDDDEFYDV